MHDDLTDSFVQAINYLRSNTTRGTTRYALSMDDLSSTRISSRPGENRHQSPANWILAGSRDRRMGEGRSTWCDNCQSLMSANDQRVIQHPIGDDEVVRAKVCAVCFYRLGHGRQDFLRAG